MASPGQEGRWDLRLSASMHKLAANIAPLYYLLALVLAAVVTFNANAAALDYGALYEHFSAGNRADNQMKSVLEALSFGLYRGASDNASQIALVLELAEQHEGRARLTAWLLLGISVLFLAARAMAPGGGVRSSGFIVHLLGVASVFLLVGLLAPILSLVAYTDVLVLGKVVFKYESKGIVTTVVELLQRGNVFIALTLLTFSVVTPLIKHVFTYFALRAADARVRERYVKALSAIGKWSMADVLVVAIVLAFFIAGADQFSDSWLGVGLYFFTGYCVMSLAAVQLVTHMDDCTEASADD